MSKKELNIYYKGSKQKIKYYDSINEDQIKKTVKQIFKINEPLEQIFFQDEDGDILILNEHNINFIITIFLLDYQFIYLSSRIQFQKILQKN